MTNAIRPKARFIEASAEADVHQEIVLSPTFKAACEAALLEYVMNLNTAADQLHAMQSAYMIEGAKGFLRVLLNLGDKTPERVTNTEKGLERV